MNNIGIGIMCFGDDYYFRGTKEKVKELNSLDYPVYIITDKPNEFQTSNNLINVIKYDRQIKSYHDKMLLPKYILKNHEICIILDADLHIKDYSFLKKLKDYQFLVGISYIDTLLNHPAKIVFNNNFNFNELEWVPYKKYIDYVYEPVLGHETIWEYMLIVNKFGFNQEKFYNEYEKLQIVKEYSDLSVKKDILGNGEGISIRVSSILSDTLIQRDFELYEMIKDKVESISKKFTRPELWPEWMK